MATVNFLYRSTRPIAPLNFRLLYRYNNKDFSFGGKTKINVSKDYWSKYHNSLRVKDSEIRNEQKRVSDKLFEIEKHILKTFNSNNPKDIDKNWVINTINNFYNPPETFEAWPNELLLYLERFITLKSKERKPQTIKNYNVVKNLLYRYQAKTRKTILIPEIDLSFKDNFENYCIDQQYSGNTINKALRTIKTVCKDALIRGLEVSRQLDAIKLETYNVEKIYLSVDEIKQIEKLKDLPNYLENAKDWLIISCYTGQRISDFMRFNKDQITINKGKRFIDFEQRKTDKEMSIPIHKKVLAILEKRNGNFPKRISDQKYNDYIKVVCEKAEINQPITGKKSFNISKNKGEIKMRKVLGVYKKHELVSSHIGRKSFATNSYGNIPTTYLINITGHSTEKMLLTYIGKSNKDLAFDASKYFDQLL